MALILRNGGSQSPDRWLRESRNNHLEAKKTKADAKAAEEAKKAEAESVLKKLLASGMSADEILEKLK